MSMVTMRKDDKTVTFAVFSDGTARYISSKNEVIHDFADVYIRLRDMGYEDIKY